MLFYLMLYLYPVAELADAESIETEEKISAYLCDHEIVQVQILSGLNITLS